MWTDPAQLERLLSVVGLKGLALLLLTSLVALLAVMRIFAMACKHKVADGEIRIRWVGLQLRWKLAGEVSEGDAPDAKEASVASDKGES
jgi:hypothetical protein